MRRRAGESFLIGDHIEVEVLELGTTQVKLGIRAPKEIPVLRKEVRPTDSARQTASQMKNPESISATVPKPPR